MLERKGVGFASVPPSQEKQENGVVNENHAVEERDAEDGEVSCYVVTG